MQKPLKIFSNEPKDKPIFSGYGMVNPKVLDLSNIKINKITEIKETK